MAKTITNPAKLLNEPLQLLYDLLGQLIDSGLTPAEARDVLCTMMARVLATHPATAPVLGVTE